MPNDCVNWLSEKTLKENLEASITRYKFIEKDFSTCLEYVMLTEQHLPVYSFRFADLILRIGPEILRIFSIYLFNERRGTTFGSQDLIPKLLKLQKKIERRRESFMDYFEIFDNGGKGIITKLGVELKHFDSKYIVPFAIEPRNNAAGKQCYVIPWWDEGYNALRHRVINEFAGSATLKNTLFSLAAYWILRNEFIGRDSGLYGQSEVFGEPTEETELQNNGLSFL